MYKAKLLIIVVYDANNMVYCQRRDEH
jgi:hypothetical protein